MNKQELKHKLNKLQQEYGLKKKEVMKKFCDANNPYQVGDKFTDHIGTIIIEKIRYSYTATGTPRCIYFGTDLNNNDKRYAWQSNDVSVSA